MTDFGIARAGASQMTEAGSIMGTAQYLSPEQARGAPVTASSDLYSAAIVLYEMLTGKVPFTGDSAIEIAMKHLNDPPKPPSKIRPEIPEELDAVVLRALAKNPEDRYQTAEEFSEDLHRVEAGLPLAPETSEAATALLAGAALMGDGGSTEVLAGTAATTVGGPPPPTTRRPPPPTGPAITTSLRGSGGAGLRGSWSCSSWPRPASPAGTSSRRSRTSSPPTSRSPCRTSSA